MTTSSAMSSLDKFNVNSWMITSSIWQKLVFLKFLTLMNQFTIAPRTFS